MWLNCEWGQRKGEGKGISGKMKTTQERKNNSGQVKVERLFEEKCFNFCHGYLTLFLNYYFFFFFNSYLF